jgi:hypothetical protein
MDNQLARDFLERMLADPAVVGSIEPMTQEDFADRVTRRMDRGKDMQQILREQFGVNSILEGIQRGVFPRPPRGV